MQGDIENLIRESIDTRFLQVDLDGNHCTVTVVSEQFDGLRQVARQQKVYQCLNEKIASGEIHAINIKALTPQQWQDQSH